jgi:hypothetical protein
MTVWARVRVVKVSGLTEAVCSRRVELEGLEKQTAQLTDGPETPGSGVDMGNGMLELDTLTCRQAMQGRVGRWESVRGSAEWGVMYVKLGSLGPARESRERELAKRQS